MRMTQIQMDEVFFVLLKAEPVAGYCWSIIMHSAEKHQQTLLVSFKGDAEMLPTSPRSVSWGDAALHVSSSDPCWATAMSPVTTQTENTPAGMLNSLITSISDNQIQGT